MSLAAAEFGKRISYGNAQSGDWVLENLINSGACSAATQKSNGGTVMTKVKQLLNNAANRNYIQK